MKNKQDIAQLLLRLTLATGFILPVMDRLGLLGAAGAKGVTWGNWGNFVAYTNTLVPFAGKSLAQVAALIATTGETVFAVGLITGFKTKWMALGAAALTLVFGFCMAVFIGIRAPFDYPVFVFTGGAWLLSTIQNYRWSIDNWLKK